jgi:transketolase
METPGFNAPAPLVPVIRTKPPPRSTADERRMADALRALALDMVERAGGGDLAIPLGMADAATALWSRALRHDAADPRWPDRDRFVLSAGHGAALLYALLHLTGYAGMEREQLQGFRRLHSVCAGLPEHGLHPAIEATTGPPGQGLGLAVGLALAERMMAARFGRSLVDHRTWVVVSAADLQEGVSREAASLAGDLRLDRLTVLWDDAEDEGEISDTTDQLRRFTSLGWATKQVDGHDPAALAAALSLAQRSRKPTLIACRTSIGAAIRPTVPNPAPLRVARAALNWPHPAFAVPPDLTQRWRAAGGRGAAARRAWLRRLAKHPLRAEFERVAAGRMPDAGYEVLTALKADLTEQRATSSTLDAARHAVEALAAVLPELVAGGTGLEKAGVSLRGMPALAPGSYAGRHIRFEGREHGMAAALNGLALHDGIVPFGATRLALSDYQRPALRLAAQMRLRTVYVLTHDSIGAGEDGPSVQPVEQLASLRAMPGVQVMRPADAMETAECWELALRERDQPSLIVLSGQPVALLRADVAENRCARGGYVLAEASGARRATLVASGSEVAMALAARGALEAEGIAVAVVSLPCWDLFASQDAGYCATVLGGAPRFGIEAACGFGWERWLGPDGAFIGMDGFGTSAPAADLYDHFGITPEAIANAVRKRLS